MENLYNEIIKVAKTAALNFRNNRDFSVKVKTDIANIVTSNDEKTQDYVINELKKIMPEATFFAEENDVKDLNNEYVFIIDPIDGTTNYAYDYKMSCISIALLKNNEAIFGVVYNPYLDECFYALKGQGAYLNNNKINVNNDKMSSSICLIGTAPYDKGNADYTFKIAKELFIKGRDIRRSGSAALDLCAVASGRASLFVENPLSPWDYAAGALIVKEAEGICDSFLNNEFTYEKRIPIYACNRNNQKELLEIINE